jgi:hypothetical protein
MGWKIGCLGCEGNLYRVRVEDGPLGGRSIIIECVGCGHEWCPGVAANNETYWWKAPGERHGQDADGDPAVGERGDVAAHMVPAEKE